MWSLVDVFSAAFTFWLLGRQRRKPAPAGADDREADRRADPLAPRQRRAQTVIHAVGIAGALQTIRFLFSHSAWTIDDGGLALAALVVGGVSFGILWIAAGAGRGQPAALRGFALGALGTVAFSAALLRDVNIDLDFGRSVERTARVINKQSSTTMRGGTNRYLRLEDWTGEGRARALDLSKYRFGQFDLQQLVNFDEHRGALGFRWIDGLRPAE